VKIICEKNPRGWVEAGKMAAFTWNTAPNADLGDVSPYNLQYGQVPMLPHSLTMVAGPPGLPILEPESYRNYAEYMAAQLEESIARFKEAKFLAGINVNTRVNQNFKNIKMVKWLQAWQPCSCLIK